MRSRFRTSLRSLGVFLFFLVCVIPLTNVLAGEVFQYSILDALMEGVFEGALTVGEVKAIGSDGIGTFHALHGEMILLDGRCFRIDWKGNVEEVNDQETVPFVTVAHPQDSIPVTIGPFDSWEEMTLQLEALIPSRNLPYLIRLHGRFHYMKTRSVPPQERPYPTLSVVIGEQQSVFEYLQVDGTLIGFWMPDYLSGINLPGFHLHALLDDLSGGGHLLDGRAGVLHGTLHPLHYVRLLLPRTEDFRKVLLDADQSEGWEAYEAAGRN